VTQLARITAEPTLDALGNPVRRAILAMLAEAPQSVGALASRLPVSRPAVSRHLRVLEEADLVTFDRRGNRNIYRLQSEGFGAAHAWLDQFWDNALARFAMVAESTAPERTEGEPT
jgi:DNA-binding transcriptional ArsR family regulator